MSLIWSMTGFAATRGTASDGVAFLLTAKSVNHRFLDLQFRMPNGLDALEMKLRQMLKARLRRGHVDVTLSLESLGDRGGELRVDEALLASAIRQFRDAALRHGLSGEPDLNVMLRLPGVMGVARGNGFEVTGDLEEAVLGGAGELIEALLGVRAAEGAALVTELRASMLRIREISDEIATLREQVRGVQMERLRLRLQELLQGADLSEDRLLTEAALLVERSDIEEENVRLLTHVERFLTMLDEGGEVGKRMDFLLQELNREANTMLSKTGGSVGETGRRITELGLEVKTEIERAREQIQNLE